MVVLKVCLRQCFHSTYDLAGMYSTVAMKWLRNVLLCWHSKLAAQQQRSESDIGFRVKVILVQVVCICECLSVQ